MVAQELVADTVEFVGGDAGGDVATNEVAGLGGEGTGDPHAFDGVGVLHFAACVCRGGRPVDVLGAHDVLGHGPPSRDGARLHGGG